MKKIFSLLILLFVSTPLLWAAVTPNSGIAIQTPNRGIVQFLQGTDSAGTYKTLYTAGANGSKINAIMLTSNDSTAHLVTCQVVNAAVKYGVAAASTGTTLPGFADSVPAINMLSASRFPGPGDAWSNTYILLNSGDTIQCTFATSLTSADVINLVAIGGGDF